MQSNTIYERIIELKDFDENIKNIRDNTDQLDEENEKYCAFDYYQITNINEMFRRNNWSWGFISDYNEIKNKLKEGQTLWLYSNQPIEIDIVALRIVEKLNNFEPDLEK